MIVYLKNCTLWFNYACSNTPQITYKEGIKRMLEDSGISEDDLINEFCKVKSTNILERLFGVGNRKVNSLDKFYEDATNYLQDFDRSMSRKVTDVVSILELPKGISGHGNKAEDLVNFMMLYFACAK